MVVQPAAPQEQCAYHGLLEQGSVVLQIGEAQRLSREVGDVCLEEGPSAPGRVRALHHGHRLAQKLEDFAHPAPQ